MRSLLILSATTILALAAPVMAQSTAPQPAPSQTPSMMCGCCKNMASMSQPGTMPGMPAPSQGGSTPAQPQ